MTRNIKLKETDIKSCRYYYFADKVDVNNLDKNPCKGIHIHDIIYKSINWCKTPINILLIK